MPGLAGFASNKNNVKKLDFTSMANAITYGRAVITQFFQDEFISLGCSHLGTGGQKALYQSNQVVVMFFGYLTQPNIPPGGFFTDPCAAAHYVHDKYLLLGEKMLQVMSGAFAIAVWDKRNQNLLLITDFLGLRPIYYSTFNGIFRFSSEVKGILSDPFFSHKINVSAFADFFYFGHILGEKTLLENIQMVPPASILRYDHGQIKIKRYWDFPFPDKYPHHPDRWYDDLINNAIDFL